MKYIVLCYQTSIRAIKWSNMNFNEHNYEQFNLMNIQYVMYWIFNEWKAHRCCFKWFICYFENEIGFQNSQRNKYLMAKNKFFWGFTPTLVGCYIGSWVLLNSSIWEGGGRGEGIQVAVLFPFHPPGLEPVTHELAGF